MPDCALNIPTVGAPENSGFFVPGDQHVAQRNLAIVASTHQALTFRVNTLKPGVDSAATNRESEAPRHTRS